MASVIIPVEALHHFAVGILKAVGYAPKHADETADLLVWADARGIASHGVMRIPRYVEMAATGQINLAAKPRVATERGAMAIIEGDRAPGAASMNLGVGQAIKMAKALSIGWCSVRNISHAGAIGYFASKVVAADCIGIVMTASKPLMTYHGGRTEALSTNPLAIAAPAAKGMPPIVLDMSTSAAALGKIMSAKSAGRAIPSGWGVDANGADTTDPRLVKSLVPMAGAKGSGLSLMIEIMSSVLIANPILSTVLTGSGDGSMNGIVAAIDIAAFGDVATFRDDVATLATTIQSLPKADGVEAILLPGQRGAAAEQHASINGIELSLSTAKALVQLASRYDIDIPSMLQ